MRKSIRACVAMLMSALLIIGMCFPVSALTNDYDGHWAGATVAKWVDLGFLETDTKDNLQPDEAITRGRFMSMVNKSMGYTGPSDKIKDFTDIPADSPYYGDIAIALGAGYISGTSATTMIPEGLITREQIMTVFCRIAGVDANEANSGILNAAKDSGEVSGWAKQYVAAAIQNGYLAGSNGYIRPLQHITLGEATVLLDRLYTGTHVYAFPWTYGPGKNSVKMNNVIVLGSGVKLQNIVVNGNLSIDKNTVISGISLSNVTVNGVMSIEGSGLETLFLQGGNINEMNLQGENISLSSSGGVIITKLIVNGKNAKISLAKDSIIKLAEIKASAKFTGDGTIEKAIVSAKDVDFSKKPNAVSTTGGGSYTIAGVTPSTPGARTGSGGSSSGGGGTHNVSVTGVSLNNDTLNLTAGGATAILTATVSPANATKRNVTWSSSAPAVATVANGVVTPLTPGSTTITVTTVDGGFTDTCAVNVAASVVSVTGVNLDSDTLNLIAGGATATLAATVSPANATNRNVSWSSSAPTVAEVVYGVVTPLTLGNATITVTTEDGGFTDTCAVTVIDSTVPVTGVSLDSDTLSLTAGGAEATLTATVSPADATNRNVSWSSSAPTVAEVVYGVVTPLTPGSTTITVTTVDGGYTDTCAVTVIASTVPATGVTLNADYVQALAGGPDITLIGTVSPAEATDKTIAWSSSNQSIATVDSSGKVTPLAKGTTTITAKTHNNLTDTCEIEVKEAAASLSFVTDEGASIAPAIATGAHITIAPKTNPANAYLDLEWESVNGSVAAVDENTGEVTGVSPGTATITATNHNGKAASYTITVKPALTNVTLPSTAAVPFKGSVPLTVTLAPSGALGEYLLESSDPSIAYVDKDNNLIGVSAGTATITAKINGAAKSTCTVTVSGPVAAGITPSLEYIRTNYIAPGTTSDLELGIVPSSSPDVTHYFIAYHTGYSTNLTTLFTDYYGWGGSVAKTETSVVMEVPTGAAIVSIYAYKDSNGNDSPDAGEQVGDVTVGRFAALPRIRNVSAGGIAFSMYLGGFPGALFFLDPISGGFYFDDMDGADGYYMYIVKEGELWGTYQWMKDSPTDRVGLVSQGFVGFHPDTPPGPAGYKVPMERLDFQSGNYTFYIIPYVCDPAYPRDHSDTSKLIMGNMFITNLQLSSIGSNYWIFDNE